MTLSPAAQAIVNEYSKIAYDNAIELSFIPLPWEKKAIAAALRAVVEHCIPDDNEGHWVYIPHVLAIANELDPSTSIKP
jgi:hypothetical protein